MKELTLGIQNHIGFMGLRILRVRRRRGAMAYARSNIQVHGFNPFPYPGNGVGRPPRHRGRRGAVEGAPVGPW